MLNHPDDCDRFDAGLPALLANDLSASECAALAAHAHGCRRCNEAWRIGHRADRVFMRWTAPDAPADFADRVLAALGSALGCHEVGADLIALAEGGLAQSRAAAIQEHLEACLDCAEAARQMLDLQARLEQWQVPIPPANLVERAMARCAMPSYGRRSRPPWRYGKAWLALAAGLLLALLAWSLHPAPAGPSMDIAIDQIKADRESRLSTVSFEQPSASIGSFDQQPTMATRGRRPTGNHFYVLLLQAKADLLEDGQPAAFSPAGARDDK